MAAGCSRRTGFTLIDALMGCALLTGGLVVVAGAMEGLAMTDSATAARVHARALAVSVLAELQALPIETVFQYSPPEGAPGQVRVELVNSAGQPVSLPLSGTEANAFPRQIEAHIKATCRDGRGHAIEVQTAGFLTR